MGYNFCEFQNFLINTLNTQNQTGQTIPVVLFVNDYKVLYALGNVAGPSPTPGTPAPGDAFVTVYFRVNYVHIGLCAVELELLQPCGDRFIDPTVIDADGVPISEVIKDDSLQLVRTNQIVTVDIDPLVSLQQLSPSVVVSSCS